MDRSFTKRILNGGPRFKPEKIDEANRARRVVLERERKAAELERERSKIGERLRMACKRGVTLEVKRILSGPAKKLDVSVDAADDLGVTPLMIACRKGRLLVVDALLHKKAKLNHRAKNGNSPLMEAARHGQYRVLSRLLLVDADVHMTNVEGWTALSWACAGGHLDCVRSLVQCGSDINHRSHKGSTAVMLAAEQGRDDVLDAMLDHAAVEINDQNKYGFTALHRAADGGHLSTCRLLALRGADLDVQDAFGSTPLHWACANGHEGVVTFLLSRGVSVKVLNKAHKTALMLAEDSGQEGVVRRMKIGAGWEWGAATEKEDEAATVAEDAAATDTLEERLFTACREADGYAVWRLCKAGANVAARAPKTALTPLMLCAAHNCPIGIDACLTHGADASEVNRAGTTSLMMAARRGYTPIVRRLVAATCPIDHQNKAGETALHLAAANGHTSCVSVMCLAGAAPDIHTSTTGATPMIKACSVGALPVVQVLAKLHPTSPHTADHQGWTPLMRAVSKGHADVARFLISVGVDILTTNSNGMTADDIARKTRQGVVARVVRDEFQVQQRAAREADPAFHSKATARSAARTLFG